LCGHTFIFIKKNKKKVWRLKKIPYLCIRYPENNLFTLKELIPIEDLKRLPVKAIAFYFIVKFLLSSSLVLTVSCYQSFIGHPYIYSQYT